MKPSEVNLNVYDPEVGTFVEVRDGKVVSVSEPLEPRPPRPLTLNGLQEEPLHSPEMTFEETQESVPHVSHNAAAENGLGEEEGLPLPSMAD